MLKVTIKENELKEKKIEEKWKKLYKIRKTEEMTILA